MNVNGFICPNAKEPPTAFAHSLCHSHQLVTPFLQYTECIKLAAICNAAVRQVQVHRLAPCLHVAPALVPHPDFVIAHLVAYCGRVNRSAITSRGL